jgi:hypothetical protein
MKSPKLWAGDFTDWGGMYALASHRPAPPGLVPRAFTSQPQTRKHTQGGQGLPVPRSGGALGGKGTPPLRHLDL